MPVPNATVSMVQTTQANLPLNGMQQLQMLSTIKHPPVDPTDERIPSMAEHAIDSARREPIPHINLSKLGIKIDMSSYNGGKILIVFENFVKDTLQYFMIYQLMSPEFERQRIRIL